MHRFWRASLKWSIRVALLVLMLVAGAPLIEQLTGLAIFGNTLRGPIKEISDDVFVLFIGVSAWVDCARGRLFGPAWLRPNSMMRYAVLWARYALLWGMPLVWIGSVASIVRAITLFAFGEGAVPWAVNAVTITAIPVVIYLVHRLLKKYSLQQPTLTTD